MMDADRLRELFRAFRKENFAADEAVVAAIEDDIRAYQRAGTDQVPPDDLVELLWLMGCVLYDASWSTLQRIPDRPSQNDEDVKARADANRELLARLANAARNMPW